RHATLAQRLADARLVAVGLGGIDVPVPELERPAHGVHAYRPVRHLPDAEPEHGQLVAVAERDGPAVPGQRAGVHARDASRVISGTPASARLTGQFALAPSASLTNVASSMPAPRPLVTSSILVMGGAPSTSRKVTVASVWTDSTGVPARSSAAHRAIEKPGARAAAH